MSYLVNLDQMLDAAKVSNHPGFDVWHTEVENLASMIANSLDAHLGVECAWA